MSYFFQDLGSLYKMASRQTTRQTVTEAVPTRVKMPSKAEPEPTPPPRGSVLVPGYQVATSEPSAADRVSRPTTGGGGVHEAGVTDEQAAVQATKPAVACPFPGGWRWSREAFLSGKFGDKGWVCHPDWPRVPGALYDAGVEVPNTAKARQTVSAGWQWQRGDNPEEWRFSCRGPETCKGRDEFHNYYSKGLRYVPAGGYGPSKKGKLWSPGAGARFYSVVERSREPGAAADTCYVKADFARICAEAGAPPELIPICAEAAQERVREAGCVRVSEIESLVAELLAHTEAGERPASTGRALLLYGGIAAGLVGLYFLLRKKR